MSGEPAKVLSIQTGSRQVVSPADPALHVTYTEAEIAAISSPVSASKMQCGFNGAFIALAHEIFSNPQFPKTTGDNAGAAKIKFTESTRKFLLNYLESPALKNLRASTRAVSSPVELNSMSLKELFKHIFSPYVIVDRSAESDVNFLKNLHWGRLLDDQADFWSEKSHVMITDEQYMAFSRATGADIYSTDSENPTVSDPLQTVDSVVSDYSGDATFRVNYLHSGGRGAGSHFDLILPSDALTNAIEAGLKATSSAPQYAQGRDSIDSLIIQGDSGSTSTSDVSRGVEESKSSEPPAVPLAAQVPVTPPVTATMPDLTYPDVRTTTQSRVGGIGAHAGAPAGGNNSFGLSEDDELNSDAATVGSRSAGSMTEADFDAVEDPRGVAPVDRAHAGSVGADSDDSLTSARTASSRGTVSSISEALKPANSAKAVDSLAIAHRAGISAQLSRPKQLEVLMAVLDARVAATESNLRKGNLSPSKQQALQNEIPLLKNRLSQLKEILNTGAYDVASSAASSRRTSLVFGNGGVSGLERLPTPTATPAA